MATTSRRHYVAEVQDPTTQEVTTLTAATAEELDQLVDEHLGASYPDLTGTRTRAK